MGYYRFSFTDISMLDTRRLFSGVLQNHCRPSVYLSLSFLKIGSLVFSGIVHDDSWSSYLVTDKDRFLKKKFGRPNLGQNRVRNHVFGYFLKFDSLVFFEIVYNDSLQQCLTSGWGKIHENFFWGPKGPKLGPKLVFLPFSHVWFISFPRKIACNDNLGRNGPKSGPKLVFLPFSEIWFVTFR